MNQAEQKSEDILTNAELREQLSTFIEMYIYDMAKLERRARFAEKNNKHLIEVLARHDTNATSILQKKHEELYRRYAELQKSLEGRYQLKNAELEGRYMLKLSEMHERRTNNALMYARIVQDYAKLVEVAGVAADAADAGVAADARAKTSENPSCF